MRWKRGGKRTKADGHEVVLVVVRGVDEKRDG